MRAFLLPGRFVARTDDREICIRGVAMDTTKRLTRRLELFFPSSSHTDYEFPVQIRRFYNSKDLEN